MRFPTLNQLRGAIAVQLLLACAAFYEGYLLHGWRKGIEIIQMSDDAYRDYRFSQTAWLSSTAISMGLALIFAVIALRRRSEIDGGTRQVKWHWALLFVPPVCTMLYGGLIWI